jgi:hypothetical protein
MSAKQNEKTGFKAFNMANCRENMLWTIADRQKDKYARRETFFFRHRKLGMISWGTNDELRDQMKRFKEQRKNGVLHINPINNKERMINGEKWFILVVQQGRSTESIESIGIDEIGFGFDNPFIVDGMIYIFRHEANRDAVYKYVMN